MGLSMIERDRAHMEVLWHELECGAYRADLPLWLELAAQVGAPARVLDLGAGSGRVACELAHAGHEVSAIEISPALHEALRRAGAGLLVQALLGDIRGFTLDRRDFDLAIVPMQTLQLLAGERDRRALFACARGHLREGATMAMAIVGELDPFDVRDGFSAPAPDHVELDGRHYESRPLRVSLEEGVIAIVRERVVIEGGRQLGESELDVVELQRVTATQLHAEAAKERFEALPSWPVAETFEHAASEVVMLRAS